MGYEIHQRDYPNSFNRRKGKIPKHTPYSGQSQNPRPSPKTKKLTGYQFLDWKYGQRSEVEDEAFDTMEEPVQEVYVADEQQIRPILHVRPRARPKTSSGFFKLRNVSIIVLVVLLIFISAFAVFRVNNSQTAPTLVYLNNANGLQNGAPLPSPATINIPKNLQGEAWGTNTVNSNYIKGFLIKTDNGLPTDVQGLANDLQNSVDAAFQIANSYHMDVAYLFGDCYLETHCGHDESGGGLSIHNIWGLGCGTWDHVHCRGDKQTFTNWPDAFTAWFDQVKRYGFNDWKYSLNYYNCGCHGKQLDDWQYYVDVYGYVKQLRNKTL
jgi:hypothetical protein